MNKHEILRAFGGPTELSRTVGISRQAIYKWPEILPTVVQDRLIGWAYRTGNLDKLPLPVSPVA